MRKLICICLAFLTFACGTKSNDLVEELDYGAFAISLDSIMILDQGVRKSFMEAMQSGKAVPDSLYKQMNSIDISNQSWLLDKLAKYGWPE